MPLHLQQLLHPLDIITKTASIPTSSSSILHQQQAISNSNTDQKVINIVLFLFTLIIYIVSLAVLRQLLVARVFRDDGEREQAIWHWRQRQGAQQNRLLALLNAVIRQQELRLAQQQGLNE